MMLVELSVDIAQVLITFLEIEDLQALVGVCRTTASSVAYNPPKTLTLRIPPDPERARHLFDRFHPTRFARVTSIEIVRPWQVDLLVEVGVANTVTIVIIRPQSVSTTDTIDEICDKLVVLPNLMVLNLSDTTIVDVSRIGALKKLRVLKLSRTEMTDASPLASLIYLEELVCRDVPASDMRCIERMTNLRRLEVTEKWGRTIILPSMTGLTKIQSLTLGAASIVSVDDLAEACSNLRQLVVAELYVENRGSVPLDSVVNRLQQLEFVDVRRMTVSPRVLSTLSKLRCIHHSISTDVAFLVPLQNLEHLTFQVNSNSFDYQFLLQMPVLKTLCLTNEGVDRDAIVMNPNLKALLDAIGGSRQLQDLRINFPIVTEVYASQFCRFRRLQALTMNVHRSTVQVACLVPCRSLRSLTIEAFADNTSLSPIGTLTQLQELKLTAMGYAHKDYPFISHLVNLKTLYLAGEVYDLRALHDLIKLQKLTIVSGSSVMINHDVLGRLKQLRELDIQCTRITDLTPLVSLKHLRTVTIYSRADCRVLTECDHPSLLRVLHPRRNCLVESCGFSLMATLSPVYLNCTDLSCDNE